MKKLVKPQPRVKFTPDEVAALQSACRAVWEECGYDVLQSVADERGKSINVVTVSRAVAIEIALDAGRADDRLRLRALRAKSSGQPDPVVTDDFFKRLDLAPYKQLCRLVAPAFPYRHYGM